MKKPMMASMTVACAMLAAQMLGAATTSCITKIGSTTIASDDEVAGLLEGVATASSASAESGASALEGGVRDVVASADAALEGGIAVWDYSNVTDYDFTPGGMLLIIR